MTFDEKADHLLPQGWSSNRKAIEDTRQFWAGRGADLSEDEGREVLHNAASFIELLVKWHENADRDRDEASA